MFIPLRDSNPRIRFPMVTHTLLILNVGLYFLGYFFDLSFLAFYQQEWELRSFQGYLSLVSYQFLHGGLAHLLFNMLFLYVFGDNIEGSMGRWPYLN